MAIGAVWTPATRGVIDRAVKPYLAHPERDRPAPLLLEMQGAVIVHVGFLEPVQPEPWQLAARRAPRWPLPELPEHLWRQEYEGTFPPLKEEPHG